MQANAALPAKPTIICGDFNTLDTPKAALINYALGGQFTDSLYWWRERAAFERRFTEAGLSNPHRGTSTYPCSGAQLSHIVVPKQWPVQNADVIPYLYGSDHFPLILKCSVHV